MRAPGAWLRAVGATLLCAAPVVRAGEVSGQFRAADRAIAPRHAAAYPVRDPRNPRLSATEVVLSEGAVDVDAAVLALSPHQDVINQRGIGNYVMLWVRPEGQVSMNATFAATMAQYLDATGGGGPFGGHLKADLATNDAEHVSGRVYAPESVKTMGGESYEVDLRFSSAVARPTPGTPLDPRGGQPGRAFAALYAAIGHKNWPAVRSRLSRKTLAALERDYRSAEENRDYVVDMLEVWLPKKKMNITAGELRGKTAILDVEGRSAAGVRALYLVRMVEEAAGWRFDQAAIVGLL